MAKYLLAWYKMVYKTELHQSTKNTELLRVGEYFIEELKISAKYSPWGEYFNEVKI